MKRNNVNEEDKTAKSHTIIATFSRGAFALPLSIKQILGEGGHQARSPPLRNATEHVDTGSADAGLMR